MSGPSVVSSPVTAAGAAAASFVFPETVVRFVADELWPLKNCNHYSYTCDCPMV